MESIIEFKKGGQVDLGSYIDKKIKSNMNISPIQSLDKIKWDFKDSQTQYLTHKYHSYPARFIPQIPRAFIQLFSKEGDTILDPFVVVAQL